MNTTKEEAKRDKFKSILYELALSQLTLKQPRDKAKIYKELENIYFKVNPDDEFRHYYSDIFAVLSQIDRDPAFGSIDILLENIDEIRIGYRPMNNSNGKLVDVGDNIKKLYDHVSLDIQRINYIKAIELESRKQQDTLNKSISKIDNDIQKYLESIDNLSNDLDALDSKSTIIEEKLDININKAQSMQKEYITILGIFASVILSFIGGITFSTSVLKNIEKASMYRQVFIVLMISFVFLNMLYILIRFIIDINGLDENKVHYSKFIKYIDITLAVSAVLVLLAWAFNAPYVIQNLRNYYLHY